MDKTCAGPCGLPLKKNAGRGLCTKCYYTASKNGELDLYARSQSTNEHRLKSKNLETMTGDCSACGEGVKLYFRKDRNQYYCGNKGIEYAKKNWEKNGKRKPPKGVELEHFRETVPGLVEEQQGLCAICSRPFGDEPYYVDHDHKTGLIRGLLCNGCNLGLGLFRDDIDALLAAAQYLKAHNSL